MPTRLPAICTGIQKPSYNTGPIQNELILLICGRTGRHGQYVWAHTWARGPWCSVPNSTRKKAEGPLWAIAGKLWALLMGALNWKTLGAGGPFLENSWPWGALSGSLLGPGPHGPVGPDVTPSGKVNVESAEKAKLWLLFRRAP